MQEILIEGSEKFGILGTKAEFEAEGTRVDELLRLLEITARANLSFTLKIGGCEAVRDLIEAKQYGVDVIVAPMIESPYALQKFIDAKNKVFEPELQDRTKFLFNLETRVAFDQADALITTGKQENGVDGVVFGRVDYTGSMNQTRDTINTQQSTDDVLSISQKCKENDLVLVVGGGVAEEAIPYLQQMNNLHLTKFETRKVVFDASLLSTNNIEDALKLAVEFELLWLQNKSDYYQSIIAEDAKRLEMLEARFKILSR